MSAKMAVSSSITWLIGMDAAGLGRARRARAASRRRVSEASRASSAASFSTARRAVSASPTLSLSALMAAPALLRSSGDILPSVASRAEIDPFLPSAATRTASSAASSLAAAIGRKGFGFERVQIGHGAITGGWETRAFATGAPACRGKRGGRRRGEYAKGPHRCGPSAKVSRACDQITQPSAARPWPARRWP